MISLIVGLGIGSLYVGELKKLGITPYTVDSDPIKLSDFTSIEEALAVHGSFDTVHICSPNFLHYEQSVRLAAYAKIVFIETPGVMNSVQWRDLVTTYPKTRFIMVKNNQYRDEFKQFRYQSSTNKKISIIWSNKNLIPNLSHWRTSKDKAFGGVSRDLLPQLLSYMSGFFDDYDTAKIIKQSVSQNWRLDFPNSNDYSNVTSDVDDNLYIVFELDNKQIVVEANWRNDTKDENCIKFSSEYSAIKYDLESCPTHAYGRMIKKCLENLNNDKFWNDQYLQDIWIHKTIEQLQK
jgi:predicted dehydrogenase